MEGIMQMRCIPEKQLSMKLAYQGYADYGAIVLIFPLSRHDPNSLTYWPGH